MIQNPRRRVVEFIERDNDGPTAHIWLKCTDAKLECGHVINLGVGTEYRPKRMGCYYCGIRTGDARARG